MDQVAVSAHLETLTEDQRDVLEREKEMTSQLVSQIHSQR